MVPANSALKLRLCGAVPGDYFCPQNLLPSAQGLGLSKALETPMQIHFMAFMRAAAGCLSCRRFFVNGGRQTVTAASNYALRISGSLKLNAIGHLATLSYYSALRGKEGA